MLIKKHTTFYQSNLFTFQPLNTSSAKEITTSSIKKAAEKSATFFIHVELEGYSPTLSNY